MDPRAKVSFQQVRVVPSGCMQRRGLGNLHIVGSDATGAFFAFASTLAVYVYEASTFRLHRLLSTKDNVLGLAWCPFACHSAYLATVAMEGGVVLWNVTTEEILFQATLPTAHHAISLQWQPHDTSTMQLAIACSDKLIYVWTVDLEASTHSMARLLPKPTESPMTVLRWNLQTRGMLAIGFESGAIGLHHATRPASLTLITREKKRDKRALAITDMTWDSLSHLYLLVAYKDGHSALWEINETTGTQLHTFDKQGAGTNAIAWLPSAPGQFVTANARSGILKIWNVSQPQPLQHVRAQSSGIHNVAVLRDHRLLCAAVDGSVGVYDLQKRHLAWASHPGHKETIFDVRYQPSNPNVLATCSHDSSVRIWDVETMHCLQHLQGQDGVLYSVAWSPTHAALIASSSSVGSVFLWDVAVGVATVQMRHHTDAVYRVAWDTGADGLLASSSKDKTVVLALPSGVLVKRYVLPGAAFGCDWSPRGDGLLVVGCMDHVVRIFATKTASTEPLRVLAAHAARVFHTVWYADPARLLLATSSDDCTIRVWTWPEDDAADAVVPYITLTGHTGFVRALVWHAAPAPLLLSGSWDATIRIWDIHSRSCRLVVVDHLADVYGIATHPSTPCTFVSCSRDSTLRFWGLRTYESATTLLATVLSTPDVAQIEAAFVVAGMLPGLTNLFALLRQKSTREMRIQREESVVETYLEHARRLEAGLATSRRPSKTTRLNKEEHLLQAAATYLKAGNLVRYCRILADMNQWEKALAVAPGVSMSFWDKLATEYAEHLAATESEDAAVYYVATRNVESAVALYHGRNQFEDAFVVAKASETMAAAASVSSHDSQRQQDWSALRHSSRAALAAQYVDAGDPILAACCYLSVHDVESAISLELAYVLSTYLSTDESPRHLPVALVRRLAFKYEALGALPLVLQLLGTLPPLEAKYEVLCPRLLHALLMMH
ncbi:hypothetical protein SPRG_03759 [Saprolegnia parasitica CBS 223.65]|uniref:Gem-associated protein 5 TPR domain-containing protein n=1 Tax=Saprolegnia parasitica (strain CBS 223.65) TaxID=695850 RepID=A0A067CMC0_SAPPC|nr:hypothetical protein SPRG_03759 [Saprolegnia parasitica CBS 223.65]KDO31839.1 hypothetical protein SPRG_03759 [Saprolegnia parasitica CBS 223.65]|eukprot:XP_012197718.1 hypothetical protein SPRG_03759 [Saprolegnia parasitica CBS 223.65]